MSRRGWYSKVPTEDTDGIQVSPSNGTDIVQFSCAIYYVEETEGHVSIDIMRLGNMQGTVSVKFATADGSAKNGERYISTSEDVTFKQGEYSKIVKVPIIETDVMWTPTLEFNCHLSCASGCELGAYLQHSRVKVIDHDPFPSSKYKEGLQSGLSGLNEINGFALFWEYCKLNWDYEGIAWRTVLTLVMDQLHNMYRFLIITLRVYMVDTLFATSDSTSEARLFFSTRIETAYLVAACYIAPMAILHVWDIMRIRVDLVGRSRLYLQTTLFSEYLNFSEHSRDAVPMTDIQNALLVDCKELAEGYTSLLKFTQLIGKLCLCFVLILQNSTDRIAIYFMLMLPIVIGCFGTCRSGPLLVVTDKVHTAASECSELVRKSCENYRLFANYFQRPLANANFVRAVHHRRAVQLPLDMTTTNNDYFTSWLGPMMVAVYIVLCTPRIIDGAMQVGVFLATIDILQQTSNDFGTAYTEAMRIYQTCDTLRGLCVLYNMPSDLLLWKAVNQARRRVTKEARDAILKERLQAQGHKQQQHPVDDVQYMSDSIPIFLANLKYELPSGKVLFEMEGRLQVPQGKVVALKGGDGSGKSTFLRLIAHELFPANGELFVPSHLRILHVSQEVLLQDESAWQNLTFGCYKPLSDVDLQRIELVGELLGMDKLMKFVQPDLKKAKEDLKLARGQSKEPLMPETGSTCCPLDCCLPGRQEAPPSEWNDELRSDWVQELSYTEKVKLHLARAFLMNPEVMVLQRPLYHFKPQTGDQVLHMLRNHVDSRGIGMLERSRGRRRPRTVFYTAEMEHHEKIADIVWEVKGTTVLDSTKALMARRASKDAPELMTFEGHTDFWSTLESQACHDGWSPKASKHGIIETTVPQELGKADFVDVASKSLQPPPHQPQHSNGQSTAILEQIDSPGGSVFEALFVGRGGAGGSVSAAPPNEGGFKPTRGGKMSEELWEKVQ